VVSTGQLAAFAVAAFILIVIPGPGVLFVIGRALAHGRRTALASVAGHAAGNVVVAVCVALGVGALVQRSDTVFTVVKLAGAAYLIWLGVQAFRKRDDLASVLTKAATPRGTARSAQEGFVVGVTNPKAVILFAAVLPQFVDRATGHVPLQMLALGAVFIGIAAVSDAAWAVAAGSARTWLGRSPRRMELIGGTSGLVMIGLGASLAITGRED